MPAPTQPEAYLLPASLSVAELLAPDRVRVVSFGGSSVIDADGVLGVEVAACLLGGPAGPILTALKPPWLEELHGGRPLRLTPNTALRLEGFETLFLELTLRCTARCVHCYAEASPERSEQLDRKTCLEALEDAAALGFEHVQLTGGDPLLCGFLDELLEASRRLGFRVVEVFTNAFGFDEQLAKLMAERGASLAVSLYSAEPGVHDAVTGIPGSHERTCRAIGLAVAAGVPVRAVSVVTARNAGHTQSALELGKRLGASVGGVAESRAVGRGDQVQGSNEVTSWTEPTAACDGEPERQKGVLCVAGDGSVYPCIFNRRDRLGSVHERRLRDIVSAPDLGALQPARPREFLAEVARRLQCVRCRCTAWALRACAAGPEE